MNRKPPPQEKSSLSKIHFIRRKNSNPDLLNELSQGGGNARSMIEE
jgi:hypothetical protein